MLILENLLYIMQSVPKNSKKKRKQEKGNIKLNGFVAIIPALVAEDYTGMVAELPGEKFAITFICASLHLVNA